MGNFSYRKSFKKIYSLRKQILYVFLGLITFVIIGIIFRNKFMSFQEEIIRYILYELEGKTLGGIILFIIWHNIQANLFIILSSVLVVVPLLVLASNGFIIGAVMSRAVIQDGFLEVLKLLPHGVFEIPAILISFALSYSISKDVYIEKKNLFYSYWEAIKIFIMVIVPLLVIAGIIEGCLVYFFGSRLT